MCVIFIIHQLVLHEIKTHFVNSLGQIALACRTISTSLLFTETRHAWFWSGPCGKLFEQFLAHIGWTFNRGHVSFLSLFPSTSLQVQVVAAFGKPGPSLPATEH